MGVLQKRVGAYKLMLDGSFAKKVNDGFRIIIRNRADFNFFWILRRFFGF